MLYYIFRKVHGDLVRKLKVKVKTRGIPCNILVPGDLGTVHDSSQAIYRSCKLPVPVYACTGFLGTAWLITLLRCVHSDYVILVGTTVLFYFEA